MENYRSFKQWFKCPPNAWVSSSLPVRGARLHEETPTRFMNEAELPTPGSTQPTEAGSPAAPAPAQGRGIQVLPSLGSPRLHHSPTRHPHCHQHQGTQGSMEYMGMWLTCRVLLGHPAQSSAPVPSLHPAPLHQEAPARAQPALLPAPTAAPGLLRTHPHPLRLTPVWGPRGLLPHRRVQAVSTDSAQAS